MKFKFKNHEDYLAQRNEMLNQAEAAINDGDQERYDDLVNTVNAMDEAYEEFARNQANINALRNNVKVPLSATARQAVAERVVMGEVTDGEQDMEYRVQFMNYVLHGTPIKMNNQDETTTTSDVGPVIPNTILDRIVEQMEVNGKILAKITRTFYKGGLTVPVSSAKPTAAWVGERATTDKQKKAVASVTFSYHKLKVQVAVSIIVENVTLEVFERTIAKNIAEAMTKALEEAVIKGTGSGQPKGILTETGTEVEYAEATGVTYAVLAKAEGKVPEAYDDAEWCWKKADFMTQVIGMVDDNGQPIARVNVGLDGKPEYRIFGRPVNFSEHATTPFIFRFADYILNTNLNVTVSRYTDQETDDEVTKAIMLADGKVIDTNSLIKLKKA